MNQQRSGPRKITVFGAGVTGLTAAHELAERGFAVEVIDPDINPCIHARTRDRGIGGMARSQFVCDVGVPASAAEASMRRLWPAHEAPLDDTTASAAVPVLPGEHGFRFFPSFYRHLFDTMKRTPILSPGAAERSHATVFDNLVPTGALGFARDGDARSFLVPRRRMTWEAFRRVIDQVLSELEYSLEDIARFQIKLFKYVTSSSARREREYEAMSWSQFLDLAKYTPISREHLEFGPQMAASLRGSSSDTRTQGNVTIQLLLDQVTANPPSDATLDGPTSSAWLDHWHDYLLHQGVTFTRDRLIGFTAADQTRVLPVLASQRELDSDGYVIALSLPALIQLAPSFAAFKTVAERSGTPLPADNDFDRVTAFVTAKSNRRSIEGVGAALAADLAQAAPRGPLQHMSGIQYYFDTNVRIWRGHTQYLDSAWGLTSIVQTQFWGRPRSGYDGYRAILSVDIGIWDRPYQGKLAWQCTADEIAHLAWEQIRDHHQVAFAEANGAAAGFPQPFGYALDQNLEFVDDRAKTNHTPFLVNRVKQYRQRPGRVHVAGRGATPSKAISRYAVYAGQYVLAGTFMQTYTRLTSMEGANEAARHAVNALLDAWRVASDRCEIWDPEDNEPLELDWFKELDDSLLARGLPHFTDILGWQHLPEHIVPGDLATLAASARRGAR